MFRRLKASAFCRLLRDTEGGLSIRLIKWTVVPGKAFGVLFVSVAGRIKKK